MAGVVAETIVRLLAPAASNLTRPLPDESGSRRRERGLARADVGDDVGDVFLESDFLKGLESSHSK